MAQSLHSLNGKGNCHSMSEFIVPSIVTGKQNGNYHMSSSLHSLMGGHIGDYIADY